MMRGSLAAICLLLSTTGTTVTAQSEESPKGYEFGLIAGSITVWDFSDLIISNQGLFPIFGNNGFYLRIPTGAQLFLEPQLSFLTAAGDGSNTTFIDAQLALGSEFGRDDATGASWYAAARVGLNLIESRGTSTTVGGGGAIGRSTPVFGGRVNAKSEIRFMYWDDSGITTLSLVLGMGVPF